jgi:hypothetical protein
VTSAVLTGPDVVLDPGVRCGGGLQEGICLIRPRWGRVSVANAWYLWPSPSSNRDSREPVAFSRGHERDTVRPARRVTTTQQPRAGRRAPEPRVRWRRLIEPTGDGSEPVARMATHWSPHATSSDRPSGASPTRTHSRYRAPIGPDTCAQPIRYPAATRWATIETKPAQAAGAGRHIHA